MPRVFLSYARADVAEAQSLEQELRDSGVTVWRDQENLYAGQQWPKMLGEAIAAHDVVLLAWSKDAAASDFVELEWCTALALKKIIIPYLLDETALPPSLAGIQGINGKDSEKATTKLLQSLTQDIRQTDSGQARALSTKLGEIPSRDAREVLRQAKIIFEQSDWNVSGNVYQAAGDMHITHTPSPPENAEKTILEKWQTWVAIVVGILTAIFLVIQLGKEIPQPKSGEEILLIQPLEGSIRNEENQPLPGVKVALPKYVPKAGSTDVTDELGRFQLKAEATKEAYVEFIAQKDDYVIYEDDFQLGTTSLQFTMNRENP